MAVPGNGALPDIGMAKRISSAMLSAIGPTTTCKLPPLPGRTTAIAPSAFRSASTALLRSTMSRRRRVVQAPTLSRLAAPPKARM
ncbi:hypothetical protein D3C85_1615350 [compost metagenome]